MGRRSGRLVVRVVHVPAGAGAADARRRVAEVLLRAAVAAGADAATLAPPAPANGPLPAEKVA